MTEELPRQDEILKKEEFSPPLGGIAGLRDRIIDLKVRWLEKIQPPRNSWFGRENDFSQKDSQGKIVGEEQFVTEKDLPIMAEAAAALEAAKTSGRFLNKEHNPAGDNLKELRLKIFGDIHIRGSELSETVTTLNRNKLLESVAQKIPDSWEIKKFFTDLPQRLQQSAEEDAERTMEGFLAFKNRIIRSVREGQGLDHSPDSATVLLNVGDNGFNEHRASDMALVALALEEARQEMEQAEPIYAMHSPGNHDTDLNNFDLEHDLYHHELFGNQVFLQEIGDDAILLSLDTNLYSYFWRIHLERRKEELANQLDQLTAAKVGEDDSKLAALEEEWQEYGRRQEKALSSIRQRMELQKKLIEEAKGSGKQIILVGHQEELLKYAMGEGLDDTRVITIVAGHTHIHRNETIGKNKDDREIRLLRVGANLAGVKVNKSVFSGFSVKINAEGGDVAVEVEELYPEQKDFDYAQAALGLI